MKKDYRSGSDLTRFRAFCYSLECYVGTSTFNTLTFELYHSQKANRDTYSKPPWALRVPFRPSPNDILTHLKGNRIEMKKDYRSGSDLGHYGAFRDGNPL